MKKTLTPFMAGELLFEYLEGRLEGERKNQVEKALQENSDLKNEMQKLVKGKQYLDVLGQGRINSEILVSVSGHSTVTNKALNFVQFHHWPPGVKIGLEVLTVAAFVSLAVIIIPWHKMKSLHLSGETSWVVSEVDRRVVNEEVGIEAKNDDGTLQFPDEKDATASGTSPSSTIAAVPTTVAGGVPNVMAKVDVSGKNMVLPPDSKVVAGTGTTIPKATGTTVPPANATAAAVAAAAEADKKDDGKRIGYVYRGTIKIANNLATTPKITEKLMPLGARKAGEVELGWKKGESATYFHFMVPEARYQEVLDVFNTYGKLVISKDRHDRVMPDGIIRLIIDAQEANVGQKPDVQQPTTTQPSTSQQPPAQEDR